MRVLLFNYQYMRQNKYSGVGEFIFSAKPAFAAEKSASTHALFRVQTLLYSAGKAE